jgi:hypothetical protein
VLHIIFLSEILKDREQKQLVGVDEWIILKYILKKQNWRVWAGLIRLRISSGGSLL